MANLIFKTALLSFLLSLFACGGGGSSSGGKQKTTGDVSFTIISSETGLVINAARIEIYDANNAYVEFKNTNSNGIAKFNLLPATYTAHIQAQGYNESPPRGISAVPFEIILRETIERSLSLTTHADPVADSMISGNADVAGMLVIAEDSTQQIAFSGITNTTGDYILFNIPPGNYIISGFQSGFSSTTANQLVTGGEIFIADIDVIAATLPILSGQITFLATENGTVDITLLHPITLDTIPGLQTSNVDGNYTLENVPTGDYLAWASLVNDTYVMDPDWIVKNGDYPAALAITVGESDVNKNFSVTGAIKISAPTNTTDELVPEVVTTLTPTFSWESYSSTKQYAVEVFDLAGNSIWGGFDGSTGLVAHTEIDTALSAQYNFDGSASEDLVDGGTYLWRVYALKWDQPSHKNIAISASEDQLGLFTAALSSTEL